MHEIHFCGQMRYHGKVCSARVTIHSPLMSPLQPEPFQWMDQILKSAFQESWVNRYIVWDLD